MANARGTNTTYIPPVSVGLALGSWGLTLCLWGFALGQGGFALDSQGFLDTNMFVKATRNTVVPLYVATLTKDHPSYKATISENKPCITVFDIPSRETTPLIRPDFAFPKGGLIGLMGVVNCTNPTCTPMPTVYSLQIRPVLVLP